MALLLLLLPTAVVRTGIESTVTMRLLPDCFMFRGIRVLRSGYPSVAIMYTVL